MLYNLWFQIIYFFKFIQMAEETKSEAKAPDTITKEGKKMDTSNDKLLAAVSTIGIVGLILYFAMPDASAYVKNYARQGGTLFGVQIVYFIVSFILGFIPILNVIFGIISCLVWIVFVVAWIILLIKAVQEDKEYKLPLIGDLASKILK